MTQQLSQKLVLETKVSLEKVTLPEKSQLEMPETILQFGSGALLRGLVDFFIDKAQREGSYQGRVVIVNNTRSGRSTRFNDQEGLFTLCEEGYEDGETIQKFTVNAAVSQALPAADHWQQILAYADKPEVTTIISNTTEVGISLQEEDDLQANPPQSYPGKLTAFLHKRFAALGSSSESGVLILPTELILDNGDKLKSIVNRLAVINGLESEFTDWVNTHCIFCNTLVDRIVPGEPDEGKYQKIEEQLGYQDQLLTVSEVYRLFAVEGPEDKLLRKAPWLSVDKGIIISDDITPYRERKLRILNGGHTISVAAGFLSSLETVYDCMQDDVMSRFISQVIYQEIVPSLDIDQQMAKGFASDVLDRFRNPFLNHKLISITLQYTSKMDMRNGLTFKRYYKKEGKVPTLMCAGFAAYLMFLHPVKQEDNNYYGVFKGQSYPINDDQAAYFYDAWQGVKTDNAAHISQFVDKVLGNTKLWSQDLKNLGDFTDQVKQYLTDFAQHGVKATLAKIVE